MECIEFGNNPLLELPGRTGDVTPTAVVCPPYCLCSWHPQPPRGQYFVPGTTGAHVMPTSSSTSTSHVTHVMLTNEPVGYLYAVCRSSVRI